MDTIHCRDTARQEVVQSELVCATAFCTGKFSISNAPADKTQRDPQTPQICSLQHCASTLHLLICCVLGVQTIPCMTEEQRVAHLLTEHGLGLSTESGLFPVITPLTCSEYQPGCPQTCASGLTGDQAPVQSSTPNATTKVEQCSTY